MASLCQREVSRLQNLHILYLAAWLQSGNWTCLHHRSLGYEKVKDELLSSVLRCERI